MKRIELVEPAIRDFLAQWNEAPIPIRLQQHFSELRVKATVPSHIVEMYEATMKIFTQNDVSDVAKREAAKRFSRSVTSYIETYDPTF